jgi:2-iminobutanoate/2-iminopropanoate deaminase
MTMQRIFAVVFFIGLLTGVALTQGRQSNRAPQRPQQNVQPEVIEGYVPARRYINPPSRAGHAPFSDAVQIDNTLYLSGRFGIDPRTGQVPAEVTTEVRIMLEGVRSTLAEAGMTMDDLVMVQVFMTDLALYDQFNAIYRSYFTRAVPARAVVGTGKLLRGARFEIQGIAVRTQ